MKDEKFNLAALQRGSVPSEIAVDDLKIDDLGRTPHLLDGMKLCAGCEDKFVLGRYCENCARMMASYEAQRSRMQQDERRDDRIDLGVVPHQVPAPDLPDGVASRIAVGLIFIGAVCSAMFLLTGMWYVGRGLVGYALRLTQ